MGKETYPNWGNCCSVSRVWLSATPWTQRTRLPRPSPSPGTCSNSCPSSQWCQPTISSFVISFSSHLQSFPASVSFSSESVLPIRWPKNWRFNSSIGPFNEYSGLISFRKDSFDLLAVQGTLKSLFQHHNSKTSILYCSAFFMVPNHTLTTRKTIALTTESQTRSTRIGPHKDSLSLNIKNQR